MYIHAPFHKYAARLIFTHQYSEFRTIIDNIKKSWPYQRIRTNILHILVDKRYNFSLYLKMKLSSGHAIAL